MVITDKANNMGKTTQRNNKIFMTIINNMNHLSHINPMKSQKNSPQWIICLVKSMDKSLQIALTPNCTLTVNQMRQVLDLEQIYN